ncbi:hypothetical protein VXE65_19905 [Mycolicibacterium conceptionense]|uniref:hypothetical protein n=1 Tax=Mycolicibacterium conceptionense TaxID=451644 RepID=UPI0032048264
MEPLIHRYLTLILSNTSRLRCRLLGGAMDLDVEFICSVDGGLPSIGDQTGNPDRNHHDDSDSAGRRRDEPSGGRDRLKPAIQLRNKTVYT